MKKMISVLLVLAMALTLVACGSSTAAPAATGSQGRRARRDGSPCRLRRKGYCHHADRSVWQADRPVVG